MTTKKTYEVDLLYTAVQYLKLEATSEEEAVELARQEGGHGLCHHCANQIEIDPDPYKARIDKKEFPLI